MRYSSAILAASFLVGFASAASAADTDGWYIGGEAGLNIAPKEKFSDTLGNHWSEKNDYGYGILGQVGYGMGPYRLEGEVGFRSNDVKTLATNTGVLGGNGNLEPVNFSLNAYYDFKNDSPWTPYLGAGIGAADLNANNFGGAGKIYINNDDFVVAYQGIAGISYAIDDNLSIKADYRYIRAPDVHITETVAAGSGTAMNNYGAHSILVGFTYKFGGSPKPAPVQAAAAPAPMPPPPPPPPPAPKPIQVAPIAKNFQVFFDFDKSDVTTDAEQIIKQAAAAANDAKTTSIQLIGHTDSVGTEAYNLRLSIRRAEAVKADLVKLGVPASEIGIVGKGKADQLIPTKDGVREPQNRRVQIILQ